MPSKHKRQPQRLSRFARARQTATRAANVEFFLRAQRRCIECTLRVCSAQQAALVEQADGAEDAAAYGVHVFECIRALLLVRQ